MQLTNGRGKDGVSSLLLQLPQLNEPQHIRVRRLDSSLLVLGMLTYFVAHLCNPLLQVQTLLQQLLCVGGTALVAYGTPTASAVEPDARTTAPTTANAPGYAWTALPSLELVSQEHMPGFTIVHLRRQSA